MAEVFISYSVKDEPFAKRIYNALSSLGVSTFLAGISLKPGSNWTEEISSSRYIFRKCRGFKKSDFFYCRESKVR